MNVCPVCEAPALALVCEVCGHAFAAVSSPDVPVDPLLDLDAPLTADGAAPSVPLAELEPTRFPSAPLPSEWSDVEWERTSVAGVPDVAAGGLAEMDTGREEPSSERTSPSVGPVTCRYCRHVQASGTMCDGCGMRLPWSMPVAASAGPPVDRDALVRCQRCGERTYQRERCSSCGGLLTSDV
jgi:hypothetical protein